MTLKGAAQYMKPYMSKKQDRNRVINEDNYFKNILKNSPNF